MLEEWAEEILERIWVVSESTGEAAVPHEALIAAFSSGSFDDSCRHEPYAPASGAHVRGDPCAVRDDRQGVNGHGVNGHGANGHGLAGANGHGLAGANGHGLAGANGHGVAGVNGHGVNGHGANGHGLAGANGHDLAGANGHGLVRVNGHGHARVHGRGAIDGHRHHGRTIAGFELELEPLLRQRLIRVEASRVSLTRDGQAVAGALIRRHRLAERLVVDVMCLKGDIVDEFGCRFEHLVHQGLEESICTLLGHPKFCPHGRPIPAGDCCTRSAHSVQQLVVTLAAMKPRQRGVVAYLDSSDGPTTQKLMAMGVLPGETVELDRRTPAFVYHMGHSQFAVDDQVARAIFVRLERTGQGTER